MVRRFVLSFLGFIGLIIPATFAMALLVAPAQPKTIGPTMLPGCERNLAAVNVGLSATQARLKHLGAASGPATCSATRLYFLEVVKARAVTAVCRSGPERDRELGRLDADVEHINDAIASRCSYGQGS
jgi:hypothetical protein